MQSVKLHSHVGRDGILKLEVPVGLSEVDLEVVVIVHPVKKTAAGAAPRRGWPPDFLKRVAGAWKGELVREPQGEYEARKPLE